VSKKERYFLNSRFLEQGFSMNDAAARMGRPITGKWGRGGKENNEKRVKSALEGAHRSGVLPLYELVFSDSLNLGFVF